MSDILVTGSSGFIGKHLVTKLESEGHKVISINRSSGNIQDSNTWASFPPVDCVIHLAGKSFVPDSWLDPSAFIEGNFSGTINALEFCKKNAAKLIFLSSYLYGNPVELPISESSGIIASNPYGLSKKISEEACNFYAYHMSVDVIVLRLFNVYGPGQSDDFLIPTIFRQINEGKSILIKDVAPKRDYVYIDDVISSIILSVNHREKFSVFNIGSGLSYSVGEIIEIIQRIKGTDLLVKSKNERRQDEIMNTIADISLANKNLGWKPKWSIVEGLRTIS